MLYYNLNISLNEDFEYSNMSSTEMSFEQNKYRYIVWLHGSKLIDYTTGYNMTVISEICYHRKTQTGMYIKLYMSIMFIVY